LLFELPLCPEPELVDGSPLPTPVTLPVELLANFPLNGAGVGGTSSPMSLSLSRFVRRGDFDLLRPVSPEVEYRSSLYFSSASFRSGSLVDMMSNSFSESSMESVPLDELTQI